MILTPMLARLAEKAGARAHEAEVEAWASFFSQVALVLAAIGFLGVVAYLMLKRNQTTYERARRLPLEED